MNEDINLDAYLPSEMMEQAGLTVKTNANGSVTVGKERKKPSQVIVEAAEAIKNTYHVKTLVSDGLMKTYVLRDNYYEMLPQDPNVAKNVLFSTIRMEEIHPKPAYIDANTAKKIYDTIQMNSTDITMEAGDDIIYIGNGTYWNRKDGILTPNPDLAHNCFHHLCDTSSDSNTVPKIDIEDLDIDTVLECARRAKQDIAEYEEDPEHNTYPERFDTTISVWANHRNYLYVDILKMMAGPLMKKLPPYAFFLVGSTGRNGKSTLAHLVSTIYGVNNCAYVRSGQLSSWDYNNALVGKMVNAPDENDQDQKTVFGNADFKSMAVHDAITLRKKNGQPFTMRANFECIFPMNEEPSWNDLDPALIKRLIILTFDNDLSKSDRLVENFEHKTFTPEFLSQIIGELLGIAQYYSDPYEPDRKLYFSKEALATQKAYLEEHANVERFEQEFSMCFGMIASKKLVGKIYERWCETNELTPESKSRLDTVFTQKFYNHRGNEVLDGMVKTVYKNPDSSAKSRILYGSTPVTSSQNQDTRTVDEWLEIGQDPVSLMLFQYNQNKLMSGR